MSCCTNQNKCNDVCSCNNCCKVCSVKDIIYIDTLVISAENNLKITEPYSSFKNSRNIFDNDIEMMIKIRRVLS